MNDIVCFEHLTQRFGTLTALSDLNLELRAGQLSALLGPNGAGKTTAIDLMLGLSSPTQGTVRVMGSDPRSTTTRAGVGAMLQDINVPAGLGVRELVTLYAALYPSPMTVDKALTLSGLTEQAKQRVSGLSGGQKRRLSFALAVVGQPKLLLLDEPTVGMDVQSRNAFWQGIAELRSGGCTVLLTTHLLEEVDRAADRVILLNKGKLVADGTPSSIRERVGVSKVRFSSQLAGEQLRALPGADTFTFAAEGRASFSSRTPELLVRAALDADPDLKHLEVSQASLEDAFLSLTSDSLTSPGAVSA
ncbi:ABC transporter ATP-binding protein [Deinococcus psychrotolerans]|uniref:ABC transporter ATP-binding protein n=1 Tax=Deinococcus psychrotolerans TaxID=2489213 RepID=A0A3G8YC57_9DEIO|nr:ABC transporter ATP-binding protein [Deinococcus psychrotolerans]AZI42888.1 ABC transporter ATP-binding protein [Deinococcus psychrotolerans]